MGEGPSKASDKKSAARPPPPRLLSSRSGSATDDEWKRPVPKHPESKFFIKKRASFVRSRMPCIILSEVDGSRQNTQASMNAKFKMHSFAFVFYAYESYPG